MHIGRIVASVTAGALYCGAFILASCGGDGETVTNTVEVCPSAMTECSGVCVETTSNPAHCGACDNGCASGEYCAAGTCTATSGGCPTPLTDCSGACVDMDNDPDNCGSCANPCGVGEYCSGGACASSTDCPLPLMDCGGTCTNINTDSEHCGGCTTACGDGEKCDGSGICALTCQTGFIDCNGTCVDPNTDNAFCGATGDCLNTNAGATCVDGEKCGGAGVCALSCQTGSIDCNGTCVDPNTSNTFCGATGDCQGTNDGTVCGAGQKCNGSGVCALTCQNGLMDCNGTCIDPATNETYCGATGNCQGGTTCGGGQICSGSACVTTCGGGLVLCGTSCVDPNFDPAHCGVTAQCTGGATCTSSQYCDNGTCTATSSGGTSCATTTATTTMPAQTSTYGGMVRGYWFTALSDFIITGVNVPTVTGNMSLQVMRFNSGPPPIWSTTTTDFTTLAYIKSNPAPSFVNVCIPVFTGDHIGILGQRGTSTSYASGAPHTVTINGDATTINRFGHQANITTSPAGAVWSQASGEIGRIELQTAPM